MLREEAIEFGNMWLQVNEDSPNSNTYKFFQMAIKALEQEPVLDKLRAEIDVARFVDKDTKLCKNVNASGLEVAMKIIDKYKAEIEPQKSEDNK